MPRLPHFPSRLVDNRSDSGVEQRRMQLDVYFRSLSRWPYYPRIISRVFKVRIPEDYLLENATISRTREPNQNAPEHKWSTTMGLFYKGDKMFEEMDDGVVDAAYFEAIRAYSVTVGSNYVPLGLHFGQ